MLRQNRPERGEGERVEYFGYVATPHGTRWHAYIAGPVQWFECHVKGRTKPCVHAITDGELNCKLCEAGLGTESIGYLPLYREVDSRPVMVIVHAVAFEQTENLKLHQRVLVGRNTGRGDGVYVLPALDPNPRFSTSLKRRMNPVDLTPTLLRMWSFPDLIAWYEEVSKKRIPRKSTPDTKAIAEALAAEQTGTIPESQFPLVTDGLLNAVDLEAERTRRLAEQAAKNAETISQWAKTEGKKRKRE